MSLGRFALLSVAFLMPLAGLCFPFKTTGLDTLHTSIWIHDLRWGYDVVSENIDMSLVPASVMKTVTCASLLNLASPQERFSTPVGITGEVDDKGVLHGNVIIHAMGDPTIDSRYFEDNRCFADSIAYHIAKEGIKSIAGDVVVDESAFADATTPPGWLDEDITWYYGARLWGANYSDNRFTLWLPSCRCVPTVPGLKFLFSAPKRRTVKINRRDGSETFEVSGNVKRRGLCETVAMPIPSKAMRAAVIERLGLDSITVTEGCALTCKDEKTIYTHHSPSFGRIMTSLMHRSDNLMAEGMLRALVPGGTRVQALDEERAVWVLNGISAHGVNIIDGSGLSRLNRLTARFLGEINRHMLGPEYGREYLDLFPLAGLDGTMSNFLADTPLHGRVAFKTGSMKGVQSYSGYVLDEHGLPTHIVVFMTNGFKGVRTSLKREFQQFLLNLFAPTVPDEE